MSEMNAETPGYAYMYVQTLLMYARVQYARYRRYVSSKQIMYKLHTYVRMCLHSGLIFMYVYTRANIIMPKYMLKTCALHC